METTHHPPNLKRPPPSSHICVWVVAGWCRYPLSLIFLGIWTSLEALRIIPKLTSGAPGTKMLVGWVRIRNASDNRQPEFPEPQRGLFTDINSGLLLVSWIKVA